MRKLLISIFAVVILTSCSSNKLYYWANYEQVSYNYLKNSDEKATEEILKTYQRIFDNQNGKRGVVPPGVYADCGFILLQIGKTDEGIKMLKAEIALYPESAVFVGRILKMLEE